jgi:hypothetical protein
MDYISKIYKQKKSEIKEHIFKIIDNVDLDTLENNKCEELFKTFNSLQGVYIVDEEYKQVSPVYLKNNIDKSRLNTEINSLKDNINIDNNGKYISNLYLNSQDGNPTITASKKINDNQLLTLNFNLSKLLEDLKYINNRTFFNMMTKFIYASIGYSLSLFSFILILYSLYNFAYHSYLGDIAIFQLIFKSTIALTLGLAVFDLAKNLLEHEVVYKEHFSESHGSNKLLEKFLISIIIALSIEALMTVFKIALTDYKDILFAVYLIVAVSIMIIALSLFNKNNKNAT